MPVKPKIGDIVKGQAVTAERLDEIEKDDWPTTFFTPSGKMVGMSLGLIAIGFGITMGIARIGGKEETAGA